MGIARICPNHPAVGNAPPTLAEAAFSKLPQGAAFSQLPPPPETNEVAKFEDKTENMSIDQKVGLLGGGQLGRMTYQAALDLNIALHCLDPDPHAPCQHACHHFEVGDLQNFETVMAFGQTVDVISIEIERVNTYALAALEAQGKQVYPSAQTIRLIQDKRTQKQFFQDHGLPTAPFVLTEKRDDLRQLTDWLPAVHKLAKDGYDGRGVQILQSPDDLDKGFDAPALLERQVDIAKEISVIVARNPSGAVRTYPVVEQVFDPQLNQLDYLLAPANLRSELRNQARKLATDLADQLQLVGIMAVELFLTQDGQLLINELAPRAHNSGHHTIEAAQTSQFSQHLRAILGLPLGATALRSQAAMINLIGEPAHQGPAHYEGLDQILAEEGVYVHLYGKAETRPGRKMGHVTVLAQEYEQLLQRIALVKQHLRVVAKQ